MHFNGCEDTLPGWVGGYIFPGVDTFCQRMGDDRKKEVSVMDRWVIYILR